MAWKWYNGTLIKFQDETEHIRRFWLKVEAEDKFDFIPGQFVTMDLPINEKRLKRWRSYSIANEPNDDNILEFCIVRLEGGAGTRYLFEDLKLGDQIKFKGPSGTFTLSKEIDHNLIWICTGTGVAPFRSMLRHIHKHKLEHKNIHLIFGTRYEKDLLYREEFLEYESLIPSFTYTPVLSREEDWDGEKGYVHEVYKKEHADFLASDRFYLCGWTAMIDDAVANLLMKMKVDKSKIIYELYG